MWNYNLGTITLRHKSDRNRSGKRRVGIYAALWIALGIFLPTAAQAQTATIAVPRDQSFDIIGGQNTVNFSWNKITASNGNAVTCSVSADSMATLTGNTRGVFPLGDTIVTCSATGAADASFTVSFRAVSIVTVSTTQNGNPVSGTVDANTEITLSASSTWDQDAIPGQFSWDIIPNSGFTQSTSGASGEVLTITPQIENVTYVIRTLFSPTDTASYAHGFTYFTITVNPAIAPTATITVPGNQSVILTSGEITARLAWPAPTASNGSAVTCMVPIGSGATLTGITGGSFPSGRTVVICSATSTSNAAFIVAVTTTIAPTATITVPGDQSGTLPNGNITARLAWTAPTASDGGRVTCSVPTGSTATLLPNLNGGSFPLGDTVVTCSSRRADSASFTVTIIPKPTIMGPGYLIATLASGQTTVGVTWIAPTASNGSAVTCLVRGSTATLTGLTGGRFPLGDTIVTCSAAGADSASFTVSVSTITVPGAQNATLASGQTTVDVTWDEITSGNGSAVTCRVYGSTATLTPTTGINPDGGSFPLGLTIITCSTTDTAADAFFTVTVSTITVPGAQTATLASGQTTVDVTWDEITATNGNPVTCLVRGSTATLTPTTGINPDGGSFPLGLTIITCSTTGTAADAFFTVTVSEATSDPLPTVSLSLGDSSVEAGQAVTIKATITPTNGISGVISMFFRDSDGMPMQPGILTSHITSSVPFTFEFMVPATTPAGSYAVAVSFKAGEGQSLNTDPVESSASLIVTAPPPDPNTGGPDVVLPQDSHATISVPPNGIRGQLANGQSTLTIYWQHPTASDGGFVTCSVTSDSRATLSTVTLGIASGVFPVGMTVVTCRAHGASDTPFTVTVDGAPGTPMISVPGNVTTTLQLGEAEAQINWDTDPNMVGNQPITASDGSEVTVTSLPDAGANNLSISGGGFAVGIYRITASSGGAANFFIVRVIGQGDRTAPEFTSLPTSRISTVPTGTRSVTVFFSPPVTATDDSGETPVILVTSDNVDATSLSVTGGNFPIGTTRVTFTAIDGSNNRTTATAIEIRVEPDAIFLANVAILGVGMVSVGDTMLIPTVSVSPPTVPGTISYTVQRYGTSDAAIDLGSKSYPGSQSLDLPATVTAGQWTLRAIFTPDDTARYTASESTRPFSIGAREVVLTVTPDPLVATVGTAFTVTPKVEFTVAGATDPITPPGDLRVFGISEGRVVVDGTTNAGGSATARGIVIPADQVTGGLIVFTVTFTPADAGQYAPKAITASVTPAASTSTRIVNLRLSTQFLTVSDQETMLTVSVTDSTNAEVSVGTVTVTEQGTSPLLGGLPGTIDLSQTTRTLSVTPGTAGLARLVISYTGGCVVADQSPCMETFADARSEHVLVIKSAADGVVDSIITITISSELKQGRSLGITAMVRIIPAGSPITPEGVVEFYLNGESVGGKRPVDDTGRAQTIIPAALMIAGNHKFVAEFTPTDASKMSHSKTVNYTLVVDPNGVAPVAPILTLTGLNGLPSGLMGTTGGGRLAVSALATAPNGVPLDGQLKLSSALFMSEPTATVTTGQAHFFVDAPVVAGVYMIEAVFVPTDQSYSEVTVVVMVEFVAERVRTNIAVSLTTGSAALDVGGTATVGDEVTLSATVTAANEVSVDGLGSLQVVLMRPGVPDSTLSQDSSTNGVYRMVLANLVEGSYTVTAAWIPGTIAYLPVSAETRSFRVVADGYVVSAVCGPFDWVEDGNGLARTYIRITGHSGASEIAVRLENTSNAITGDARRVLSNASSYGIDMTAPAALLSTWKLESLYGSFGRGDLTIEFTGVEQSDLDCDRLTRSSPLQALTGFGNRATNRDLGDGDR